MKHAIGCALLVALATGAQAQYKWTAPDGSAVYGDRPPADAKDPKWIGAGAPPRSDALAGVGYEVRRAVQNFPVVLYTTEACRPCQEGRALLRSRGVPFEERTITRIEEQKALIERDLGESLPVLAVGRKVEREFNPAAWTALLDAAGYPPTSQLPRNWQWPKPRPLIEEQAAPKQGLPSGSTPAAPGPGTQPAPGSPPNPPPRAPASGEPLRF